MNTSNPSDSDRRFQACTSSSTLPKTSAAMASMPPTGVKKQEEVRKRSQNGVDHTYRDLSRIPKDMKHSEMLENPKGKYSFLIKLHEILEKFPRYVLWLPHGRALRIVVPKRLETHVFPKYFNHGRLLYFIKDLINWGFKHITKGRDRNSYYNEAFLEGLPHLCRFMTHKVRSKPRPDPANEPCFYRIHKLAPLPVNTEDVQNDEYIPEQPDMHLGLLHSMNALSNTRMIQRSSTGLPIQRPVASSVGAPLGPPNALASMAVQFSLETNRMSGIELERSLRINLLQQQHCILRGQNSLSQHGHMNSPFSRPL